MTFGANRRGFLIHCTKLVANGLILRPKVAKKTLKSPMIVEKTDQK